MIRSLDIRPAERWTPGRLPLHIALVTPEPQRRPRFCAPWKIAAWLALMPTISVLALIAAWRLLRWGL